MKTHHFLSQQEFIDLPVMRDLAFDIEIFKNYVLVAFKVIGTNQYVVFEGHENQPIYKEALLWFTQRHRLIGFNIINFDLPILTYLVSGATIEQAKTMANKIIVDNLANFDVYDEFQLEKLKLNHIDLYNVCPSEGSLEAYGARLHAKSIEGMPVSPEAYLSPEEKTAVAWYCFKDLDITELIANNLSEELALRVHMTNQFSIDLMSSSDAQIAEKVMRSEIRRIAGKVTKSKAKPGDFFEYDAPSWINFVTEPLKNLLNEVMESDFEISMSGHPELPKQLENKTVTVGKNTYKIGIGGLHSTESCQAVIPKPGGYLLDVDVASYYPAIILNNKFYPEHIGDVFEEVYQYQVTTRLEAKKAGRKSEANSRKIVVNGLYGKLSDKWSCVYSPKNMIQVTLTGQLALLMLIEYVEYRGISVVSANTDGVVFNVKNDEELNELRTIVKFWGEHTGFETEETFYKALYSRDVNNYIAIKHDNSVKTKGQAYLLPEGISRFQKNPDCNIVTKAVISYLIDKVDIAHTITSCRDIRDFVIVRAVTGGAEFVGQKLGKTVRWYYSRYSKSCITYLKSGNKVARSEGACPVQVLPDEFPDDVDFAKYIAAAEEALYLIGAKTKFDKQSKIFTQVELDNFEPVVYK